MGAGSSQRRPPDPTLDQENDSSLKEKYDTRITTNISSALLEINPFEICLLQTVNECTRRQALDACLRPSGLAFYSRGRPWINSFEVYAARYNNQLISQAHIGTHILADIVRDDESLRSSISELPEAAILSIGELIYNSKERIRTAPHSQTLDTIRGLVFELLAPEFASAPKSDDDEDSHDAKVTEVQMKANKRAKRKHHQREKRRRARNQKKRTMTEIDNTDNDQAHSNSSPEPSRPASGTTKKHHHSPSSSPTAERPVSNGSSVRNDTDNDDNENDQALTDPQIHRNQQVAQGEKHSTKNYSASPSPTAERAVSNGSSVTTGIDNADNENDRAHTDTPPRILRNQQVAQGEKHSTKIYSASPSPTAERAVSNGSSVTTGLDNDDIENDLNQVQANYSEAPTQAASGTTKKHLLKIYPASSSPTAGSVVSGGLRSASKELSKSSLADCT